MRRFRLSLALLLAAAPAAVAQVNYDTVQIRTVKAAAGVYMLMGVGGNIGVSAGADGVFLVDGQYAPLSDKIKAAVAALGAPIRFLVNTHWHWDHVGGNENFARSGVVTVAHENVRHRMSVEQFVTAFNRHVPASPAGALPLVTFTDSANFYLNGDSIHVFHVPPAHTDGDAIIWFRHANVVHMGDIFFNGRYPFVDLSSGGSVDGMIAAVDRVLALADATTKIIPGHGVLADRATLQTYRDMLATVRDRIKRAVAAGQTLEQVQAARPTAEFDAVWGKGTITPKLLVEIIYTDLAVRLGAPAAPPTPPPGSQPAMSGRELLRAMHDRYAGHWYRTLTFTQRNTATHPDGTQDHSTWLEYAALPGRLRIEILPADSGGWGGAGMLFVSDSQYVFRADTLASATAFVHPLMVLGFDVYFDPVEKTVSRLEWLKFDLAGPVREDSWEGRPVYVVGAEAGDLRTRQFWVDRDRLVFVRLLEPGQRDTTRLNDIRFNKYQPVGGSPAWVSAEVAFLVDGRPTWLEEYADIKTDVALAPALFDARAWKQSRRR